MLEIDDGDGRHERHAATRPVLRSSALAGGGARRTIRISRTRRSIRRSSQTIRWRAGSTPISTSRPGSARTTPRSSGCTRPTSPAINRPSRSTIGTPTSPRRLLRRPGSQATNAGATACTPSPTCPICRCSWCRTSTRRSRWRRSRTIIDPAARRPRVRCLRRRLRRRRSRGLPSQRPRGAAAWIRNTTSTRSSSCRQLVLDFAEQLR